VSTKEEILDVATTLFAANGYRGTSIAAIADKVGITDAGVLHHFKTKEGLLLAVLQDYGDTADAFIAASGAQGIDLLRLVRDWGAAIEAQPDISMLLIAVTTEHLTDDSPVRRMLQASYRHVLDRYIAAFATAATRGNLRSDLNPLREASALIAHLDGIRLQWFLMDRSFPIADSVRAYIDGVLERLAP